MPSEVLLETIELAVPILEAVPFEENLPSCYPLPLLRPVDESQKRSFQTIVLENPYLRATFLPELGGRLYSLFDKRTQTECLPPSSGLSYAEGGPRGVWLPAGIQWQIGEEIRRGSMASVDAQIIESEDEIAKFILFEMVAGIELSWHLWASLPPDRAEISFELRALNRSLGPIAYLSGVSLPFDPEAITASEEAVLGYRNSAGVAVHFAAGAIDELRSSTVLRKAPNGLLSPRQTDHWSFSITLVSGLNVPTAVSKDCALEVTKHAIAVQATQKTSGATLFVQTAEGQTLEAKVDLDPRQIQRIDLTLSSKLPHAALLRSREGENLLQWPSTALGCEEVTSVVSPVGEDIDALPESKLEKLRRDVRFRAAANVALAHQSVRQDDTEQTEERLEEALLFNGDDPLTWWLRAAISRDREGDSADLPNAHFLSPMEPLLRAEAFLRQPLGEGGEPSALVRTLAKTPDYLVECACRLLEAGLFRDAARWLEESLRHSDSTVLRLLAAWNLLGTEHLRSEAAIQIGSADSKDFLPPFPWRKTEGRALQDLQAAFPESRSVSELLSLCPRGNEAS